VINTIVRKEILDNLTSLRFLLLNFVCIILIPLSFFINFQNYNKRLTDYNQEVQLHQEKLDNAKIVELFTTSFSIKGYYPPSPLGLFSVGISNTMPQMFVAEKSALSFMNTEQKDDSILTITGEIDFLFLVQIIFSLLAIIFTFDAVCGEKQRGTLKLALSNAMPRGSYILGKYIAVLLLILFPIIISSILGFLFLVVLGYPLFSNEIILRIGFIFIGSVIYISTFACIGLFVSSKVYNEKTSIVVLLLIWILVIFVIPKGSNIVAELFYPIRSE
jgi:ABC-type transport system involved in multi-copper enzyme maturation permease subunit